MAEQNIKTYNEYIKALTDISQAITFDIYDIVGYCVKNIIKLKRIDNSVCFIVKADAVLPLDEKFLLFRRKEQ
jgi:hypothetical protein